MESEIKNLKSRIRQLETTITMLSSKNTCWNTLGNYKTISGITGSTECGDNYIGTANSQNLEIRLDSSTTDFFRFTKECTIEFINPASNTFVGLLAGYENTGSENVAFGYNSLSSSSSGSYNSCFGTSSLHLNESGSQNVAFGHSSCLFNRTGNNNTSIGYFSMRSNQNSDSTAVGCNCLQSNFSGNQNTAVGSQALKSDSLGVDNTAVGFESMLNLGTDNSSYCYGNTSIGAGSMKDANTGNLLTCVGYKTSVNGENIENSTALGYEAQITKSNQVVIGNSSVTEIGGNVSWSTFSDLRLKNNILENVKGLEFITKLRPVTYTTNGEKRRTGLIAQEVEKACEECQYDFDGVIIPENENDYYKISYSTFIPCLILCIQELTNMINKT